MAREKKFFAPELKHYGYNIAKRWRIEYRIPHPDLIKGKRVVLYADINKAATIPERISRAKAAMAAIIDPRKRPPEKNILQKAIERGALYWRDKTISAYSTVINKFSIWLESIPPELVTDSTIEKFLLHVRNLGKNANTVAKYRDTLFTVYQRAVKYGYTSCNPVVKVQRLKRAPQSLMYFNDTQIKRIKAAVESPQLWLAIRFLFYCFIRPGEQRHMRIDWINFDAGFIDIPGKFSKNGKNQKVSIPDHFLNEILYLREYPKGYYVLSKSGTPGKEQISPKWLNGQHAALLKKLKITGRYAFYSWKHTGAVKAVQAGINLKDLQMQLRHHSLDMVNEYLKDLGIMDSTDIKERFPSL